MPEIKAPVIVSLILVLSFLVGYKKDDLRALTKPSGESTTVAQSPTPPAVTPTPAARQPAATPAPKATPNTPEKKMSIPLPNTDVKQHTQDRNPYKKLSEKIRQKDSSLIETFGSIRRDKEEQQKALKNNAYFRTLSKQLEELQGENEAPAPSPESPENRLNSAEEIERAEDTESLENEEMVEELEEMEPLNQEMLPEEEFDPLLE